MRGFITFLEFFVMVCQSLITAKLRKELPQPPPPSQPIELLNKAPNLRRKIFPIKCPPKPMGILLSFVDYRGVVLLEIRVSARLILPLFSF